MNVIESQLRQYLSTLDIPISKTQEVIEGIFSKDPFTSCISILRTDHRRKKLYKGSSAYVAPKAKVLGVMNGNAEYFHYVPIIKTIESMLKDKSLDIDLSDSKATGTDVLKDLTDGRVFQSTPIIIENPRCSVLHSIKTLSK